MRFPSLLYVHVVGITFLPCIVRGLNTLFCFFGFSTSHVLTVLKRIRRLSCTKKKRVQNTKEPTKAASTFKHLHLIYIFKWNALCETFSGYRWGYSETRWTVLLSNQTARGRFYFTSVRSDPLSSGLHTALTATLWSVKLLNIHCVYTLYFLNSLRVLMHHFITYTRKHTENTGH